MLDTGQPTVRRRGRNRRGRNNRTARIAVPVTAAVALSLGVGIFVAILTVLGAILGVSSLVDKSGRVPGAIALAICGAGLLLALYSMIAEGM